MSKRDSTFDAMCQDHIQWMESLLAEGASTSNGDATYQSQVNELLKDTPPSSSQVRPKPKAKPKEEIQYRISDVPIYDDEEEEEDDDCEDYYVEDAAEIHGKAIPDWARAANLGPQLQKQAEIDPDTIFVGFRDTCDLNQMFSKKKNSFKVRGDSGMWQNDKLTLEEVQRYKKAVGFA